MLTITPPIIIQSRRKLFKQRWSTIPGAILLSKAEPLPTPSQPTTWITHLQRNVTQRLLSVSESAFNIGWKAVWETNTAPFLGAFIAYFLASLISPKVKSEP